MQRNNFIKFAIRLVLGYEITIMDKPRVKQKCIKHQRFHERMNNFVKIIIDGEKVIIVKRLIY